MFRSNLRQRVKKQLVYWLVQQFIERALQQFLRCRVRNGDVTIETGCNQSATDRLDDVFVQRLEVFESAAGVLQLYVNLPQLADQQTCKVSHSQIGKQIDEDDAL